MPLTCVSSKAGLSSKEDQRHLLSSSPTQTEPPPVVNAGSVSLCLSLSVSDCFCLCVVMSHLNAVSQISTVVKSYIVTVTLVVFLYIFLLQYV